MKNPRVAIIGAGPYGLSYAAYCQALGIEYILFGVWMDLWVSKISPDSILRSHIALSCPASPAGQSIINDWSNENIAMKNGDGSNNRFSTQQFLSFMRYFTKLNKINEAKGLISSINKQAGRFLITTNAGMEQEFTDVVIATGLTGMRNYIDADLNVQSDYLIYSDEISKMTSLEKEHVIIIGSGQSAAESAVIALKQGAHQITFINRGLEQKYAAVHTANSAEKRRDLFELQYVLPLLDDDKRYSKMQGLLPPSMEPEYEALFTGNPKINWYFDFNISMITRKAEKICVVSDQATVAGDVIIACTGFKMHSKKLPFSLMLDCPLDVNNKGLPIIDKKGRTSVAGFYVTGGLSFLRYGPQANFIFGTEVITKALIADLIIRHDL